MKLKKNFDLIITGLIILGMIGVLVITIRDGDRLLNRNRQKNTEPVPYYSKEHGDDKDTNP